MWKENVNKKKKMQSPNICTKQPCGVDVCNLSSSEKTTNLNI